MNKRALIAMSGGVDSSVAAYLMKSQGFECTGATMKLFESGGAVYNEKSCCSLDDAEDARSVAYKLDMPFYVFNFTADFKEQVIARFVKAYQDGATTNPCIDCNRYLKFDKLFTRARQLDIAYIATGHYARAEHDGARWLLKKAADSAKDQSYVLYSLTQEQLSRIKLPLGGLSKPEVREIAAEQGFLNANKRDSQDICFVQDNDYAEFIEQYTGQVCPEGDFIDMQGGIIGRHKGLIRYTVGQRKRLGIVWSEPLYVRSKNTADNSITLCESDGLYAKSLQAADFNWIACDTPAAPVRVKAKIRYAQPEQWATAEVLSDGTVRVEFDEAQRAVSRGQAVVLYDDDTVVGGGTII